MMKQTGRSGAAAWLYRAGLALAGWGMVEGTAAPNAQAQDETPSKATCAQAYESAQESRAAGQLQETRKRLSLCARPECPSFVQKDCSRWLEEVERELPTVVVETSGLDTEAARQVELTVDGTSMPNAIGGPAIALDPGRHELIAESAGHPSVKRVIVAQQGVQNRTVTLDFGSVALPATPAPPAEDHGANGSSLRPYAYVAWGLGAVGLGAFAVLGTLGRADEAAFKDDCQQVSTDPADVRPGICLKARADERQDIYEREFVLADVGLVTGIMGVAAGTLLFVLAASEPSGSEPAAGDASLHLDVTPAPGGGYATVGGSF